MCTVSNHVLMGTGVRIERTTVGNTGACRESANPVGDVLGDVAREGCRAAQGIRPIGFDG